MATLQHKKVYEETTTTIRPKRRRVRVGDPDFAPPDGGWGWLVCFACGFSNLCTFPMFQQFGLLFREKLNILGFSNTQITTIINMNSAFNSCSGLLNGPLFKFFSYRQIAFSGATLVAVSLFLVRWCRSFPTYIIFYAILYGTGIGVTQSANAVALNTYFKNKRRIATGLSWTTTGLGPIVWPYIITALMNVCGMEGTLLIFAAFAGHAIVCSLLLQPVHWHTKFREEPTESEKPLLEPIEEITTNNEVKKLKKNRSLLSAKYLRNEDDPNKPGYEITEPGTPCMVRSNDGWYSRSSSLVGSRTSLSSAKASKPGSKKTSGQNSIAVSRASYSNLADARSKRNSSVNLAENKERRRKTSQPRPKIEESLAEDSPLEKAPQDLKEEEKQLITQQVQQTGAYPNEKDVLKTAAKRLQEYKQNEEERVNEEQDKHTNGTVEIKMTQEPEPEKLTILDKIVIFFDLGLLKDPIYLTLMLGITIANFAEINFSILTPFVLEEFNFQQYQTATFMSLLGATDILVRFFVPFIADKIGWDNKTFFLVGVLSMAFGRIILVHTRTFYVSLFVAALIGCGKGLRTVFMALVIPSHVPLERLPAASGLQLATAGLLFLFVGPIIGWVRDLVKNYVITLHLLNIMTYTTAIAWSIEMWYSSRKNKANNDAESIKK
ncbi:uncharacterized protein LOC108737790 [Agrilus planipennis]|uniref:Uncharacterized protein LOC108737790 n=1 Tax=Agrilus planipennis TaxID=224129 RepID=A0A1W4WR55_AGRPL|nr:uncharacterized protein LOC108737790 [Agrilus planipennis]XP_018326392.1 uncharacterized protein LOC108737790 [Agrilus planipennis]XP_025831350.1 uncharacterized protein LOC108737790 [Agrilus planipennis]